jgi:hypothetical protein
LARTTKEEDSSEDQIPVVPENPKSTFVALDWWQTFIGFYDPYWHLRAYRMYALWVNYHRYYRKKRVNKLCSHWMDENEGLLEELVNSIPNKTGTCDSSYRLGYSLTYFYFLRELTRAHP